MDNNLMNNGNSDLNQQFYQQPFEQPHYQQYEQPPYEQSGYPQGDIYAQLGGKKSQTKELLALVFGVLALPFLCCCPFLGIGLGIVAIVLAVLSRNDNDGKMPGMALAGLICAVTAIAILVMVYTIKEEDVMHFLDALEDFF